MAVTTPTLVRQLTPTGEKSQLVRLLDVFVFGPLMIAAGRDQESKYFSLALTVVGVGTILYNGVNYLRTAEKQKAEQLEQLGLAQRIAPDPRRPYRLP
jgi:hypothetical protein